MTGSSSGVSRHLGVLLPGLLFGCYSNRVVLNPPLQMSAARAAFCSRQAVTVADLGSSGFPRGSIGLGDDVRTALCVYAMLCLCMCTHVWECMYVPYLRDHSFVIVC